MMSTVGHTLWHEAPDQQRHHSSAEGKELKKLVPPEAVFNSTFGQIPFVWPNVNPEDETGDIIKAIAKEFGGPGCSNECMTIGCVASVAGLCWVWCKMVLIPEGQWGFCMHSGSPELLRPGRYFLSSPLTEWMGMHSQGDDVITVPPITIIKVPSGRLGIGDSNGRPEILLPGRHVRTSTNFKLIGIRSMQDDLIEHGPCKILTVRSGGVRVCFESGKVQIFNAGRYGINSSTFQVAGTIITQQQNVKLTSHKVLLDGGVGLFVNGLLTFQVTDPGLLIKLLGERDVLQSVSQITKAEIARVFSGIHLEQISTSQMKSKGEDGSVLGKPVEKVERLPGEAEGVETYDTEGERNVICHEIITAVRPMAAQWGIRIINFALESLVLADQKYAAEYEEASLSMAKAKATRRAVEMNNDIQIQKAKAQAEALRIEAEGQKVASIIQAEAKAESQRIEAKGRNEAAETMENEFAKELAFSSQQVEFASALQAKVLTIIPDEGTETSSGRGENRFILG